MVDNFLYTANLDFENPWMFLLRNPANHAASTHAGVLEFIADEGCVHLPHWVGTTWTQSYNNTP